MKIIQLLTPVSEVRWLSTTDTVGEAFDHMETYELAAAPLVDRARRYVGTVTEADLRRHIASADDRFTALATSLADVQRRSHNPAMELDHAVGSLADAAARPFVPVVDDSGRLLGIVERRRILDTPRRAA